MSDRGWIGDAAAILSRAFAVLLIVLAAGLASAGQARAADPDFPKLTGRVTDAAGVLAPEARARIEAKLKATTARCWSSRRTSARSASRSVTGSKAR